MLFINMDNIDRIKQLEQLLAKVDKRLDANIYRSNCDRQSDKKQKETIEKQLKKLRKKIVT